MRRQQGFRRPAVPPLLAFIGEKMTLHEIPLVRQKLFPARAVIDAIHAPLSFAHESAASS
jgi:hypothetical protein